MPSSYGDVIVFFEDKVFTATETGIWVTPASCPALARVRSCEFILEVTAAAAAAGDNIQVYIQEGIRGSTGLVPDRRIRFTTVSGTASVPDRRVARLVTHINSYAGASFPVLETGGGVGVLHGPLGDALRYHAVVTNNTAPSFTATLKGYITGGD